MAAPSTPAASSFEVTVASMFALEPTDVAGVSYVASAGFFLMSSYYLIQPLSDQLALHVGIELTPLIAVGRLVLIALVGPLYTGLVNALPTESVIPTLYRILAFSLLLFVVMFVAFPSGEADKLTSFAFAVWSGVFSLFMISTFWARVAHLHTREEAKRVYGVISAGAEGGQLLSSALAAVMYGFFEQKILLVSIVLMELCIWQLNARAEWRPPPSVAKEKNAGGVGKEAGSSSSSPEEQPRSESCLSTVSSAVIGPFRVLLSTPLLRQLTLHTLLINVLVSGVWYERADAVLAAFENEKDRFTFFSVLNFCVAAITLVIQSFCFSRVLSKIGTTATLLCEPLALALGLVCTIIQPGIASIAILDGFRKVVHYSLLKPTKESLYAALPTEVQYKAKPLLDTFVYRSGSVVGAAYFTWALKTGMSAVERRTFLLILTLFWIVNSYFVGVEAERHHAKEKGTMLV
jgi:AAA family ATP:ADP antiporter